MDVSDFIKIIALIAFAYLSGSIPWGVILTSKVASLDIRQKGSGNIGAANVKRVAGLKLGMMTLACDVLKGFFPVFLARTIIDQAGVWKEFWLSIVALSAFFGHLYPLFLKFKDGGKGVATAAGGFLALSPIACCASFFVYVPVVWLSKRASLGSLVSSAVLPVAVWAATRSLILTCCAVVTAASIFYRHKDNIKRLLSGTEPAIWGKER